MKEFLTILLIGGFGLCGVVTMILLPIMYFRLTRKYDPMFPDHANLTDGIGIQGKLIGLGVICGALFARISASAMSVSDT